MAHVLDEKEMAEVAEESEHVWSSKVRTAMFLAAMRHFRAGLVKRGTSVRYTELDDPANTQTLAGELRRAVTALRPSKLIVCEPGDWRVWRAIEAEAEALAAKAKAEAEKLK